MATVDLNEDNFRETVNGNDIVLLDFWAPHCGPCHQFAPIFEEVSEKYPDIVFGKVNTEENQQIAMYFGIRSIPTLVILREQILIDQASGVVGAETIDAAIEQTQELNMDKVRAEIDAEEPTDS